MRGVRVGSWAWRVQPLYVLVELLVAAGASASYSLRDDTISALGMSTCAPGHGGSLVEVCSPLHPVMNAAFVGFGLLRAAGALVLRRRVGGGAVGTAAVAAWVVSALAAAVVGLVPVDRFPGPHALVATPVFVLQPVAVLLTAVALRRGTGVAVGRSRAVATHVVGSGLAVGALTLVAAVAFALTLGSQAWVGALERLALWPAYPWLALVAVRIAGRSSCETVTSS